jgi:hypothetical protein
MDPPAGASDSRRPVGLIALEVDALHRLTALGFRPIIFLRWGEKTWQNGIRPGGGQRLPHRLARSLSTGLAEGRIFGRDRRAFEFENEPDISFVQENPETYLAFLKACYLGVKAGAAAAANIQHPTSNFQRPSVDQKVLDSKTDGRWC